jgi:acyl carrier protein phosphodiesterase
MPWTNENVLSHMCDHNLSRYWKQFKVFCITIDKAQAASEIDELFPNLPTKFPMWIALWIMDK